MDRSFQSSFSVKSPFSPRSQQTISSKRIIPPSFRKSSRLSVSGKTAQSVQIVLKSSHNYVERFGQPLPVLITEALTFADRNTIVSARISDCGYAWVVCGRRLLIWQYRQTLSAPGTPQRKHGGINQCYELQLPQSDLAHRAELVSVFVAIGSNSPSCIAVSPEGVLRYWPAVVHEGVTVEQSVDLQGQECDSLTEVEGLGCVLATTTCTVMLVQPQVSNGWHVLQCKLLKTPSGWLGGISKRMSSLIFGPISNEHSTETRLVRVLSIPNNDATWTVYVLAGHSLQKWNLSTHDPEQLVSIDELNRLVRDSFHHAIWENCVGDQAEIDTWLLDIQSDKDSIIILAATVNMQMSPQVHYAMISFTTRATAQIRDFLLLKMSGLYRKDNPSDSLSYRFLLCGTNAYLYNSKTITVVKPQEEPDTLELNSSQDLLLGGSVCVNTPIFFSKLNGLVTVSGNEQLLGDYTNLSMTAPNTPVEVSLNESMAVNNLSVYNMDPEEIFKAHKNTMGQLKAAFIFHIRNQQSAYQDILNELFPFETPTVPGIDNTLDRMVVTFCTDLLDDIPAGDPRWNREVPLGIGSSYSMQVLHQLEDKQKALSLYLKFLKDSGLWNRLSACTMRDMPIATVQHGLTFSYGLKLINQGQLQISLLNHFVALADLILDGRKCHLESIKNTPREKILYKQYCSDRHKLIKPLLEEKEWEKAAQLAEKYLDIETLVIICELTGNEQRLDEYIDRFDNEGFSEYLYNWYLKENKQGKLVDRYRKTGRGENLQKLTNFLSDHPSLCWMQQIFDHKFSAAADTLHKLGSNEKESLTRQKTMLSMSKLAKLASSNVTDADMYVENINSHLELIAFQENLPDYVLQQFGYDTLRPRVIPAKDLVNLYICKEYADAGELEFKKALDILAHVDDAELREELHLKIWRNAIIRDSWNFTNLDSPLDMLQGTLFFRLVELSMVLGADPYDLLPHLDILIEDESMQELQENKNFQFLIRTGYEHIFRRQILD